jgi:tetratricopeptide (TPR) repeat protein
MSARDPLGSFAQAPQVGRIMTDIERRARMMNEYADYIDGEELRSAFAISDTYVLTAWHCVADSADKRVWLRLRQQASEIPGYTYVPLRVANFDTLIDVAVLKIDESGLTEARLTRKAASEILSWASIGLSTRVWLHEKVRVIGFPASASSADRDSNAAEVVDLDLRVGDATAVKLYGDAFAAVDPVDPRGMSGGPVLRRTANASQSIASEAAVAIIRAVPRGMYPNTASGGALIATHIAAAAAALPEVAQALPSGETPLRDAIENTTSRRVIVPRQLPPRIAHFTGRVEDLDRLDSLLADGRGQAQRTAVISAIDGTAGVGKTALAIHWAHRVRDQFPDGDLYVNLHGYDFSTPVEAHQVMDHFLRSLGIAAADIPRDPDARTSLYRSVLYNRRTLLVLDNAASVDQVAPLLPASDSTFALITSRSRLTGLTHATAQLSLDLMTPSEALNMLKNIIGTERVQREEDTARLLAEQCAYLPLALRIIAENVKIRPRASLATITRELGGNRHNIDDFAMVDESIAVESVFDWSYKRLSSEDAEIFRRLGLHPGAEMSTESAAALIMSPISATEKPLYRLAGMHMVEEANDRRFTFHDLMRLYAERKCRMDDADHLQSTAFENLASWYIHTANNANKLLLKRSPINFDSKLVGTEPLSFNNFAAALAWCELERVNLTLVTVQAYQRGLLHIACKLPGVLRGFYNLRKHWSDWEKTHSIALEAARQLGDPDSEASILNGIGTLMKQTNRSAEAIGYHQLALDLRRPLGNMVDVASSLDGLGTAYRDIGRLDNALECLRESLAIRQSMGDRKGQGWSFNNLGETEHQLGNYAEALQFFTLALAARTEVGDLWGQGRTLHGLAETYEALGDPIEARARYEAAVHVRREIMDRWGVAQSLDAWGDTEYRTGNHAQARSLWSEALTLLTELGDKHAEPVAAKLASLD